MCITSICIGIVIRALVIGKAYIGCTITIIGYYWCKGRSSRFIGYVNIYRINLPSSSLFYQDCFSTFGEFTYIISSIGTIKIIGIISNLILVYCYFYLCFISIRCRKTAYKLRYTRLRSRLRLHRHRGKKEKR